MPAEITIFDKLPAEMFSNLLDMMPGKSLARMRETSLGLKGRVDDYIRNLLDRGKISDDMSMSLPKDTDPALVVDGLDAGAYARDVDMAPESVRDILDTTLRWSETTPDSPSSATLIETMYNEAIMARDNDPEPYERLHKYTAYCLENKRLYSYGDDELLSPDTDPGQALEMWGEGKAYIRF